MIKQTLQKALAEKNMELASSSGSQKRKPDVVYSSNSGYFMQIDVVEADSSLWKANLPDSFPGFDLVVFDLPEVSYVLSTVNTFCPSRMRSNEQVLHVKKLPLNPSVLLYLSIRLQGKC